MGEVYNGKKLENGLMVALKFLPHKVPGNEKLLKRFRNEEKLHVKFSEKTPVLIQKASKYSPILESSDSRSKYR